MDVNGGGAGGGANAAMLEDIDWTPAGPFRMVETGGVVVLGAGLKGIPSTGSDLPGVNEERSRPKRDKAP